MIATTVAVTAGVMLYESPQVRKWIKESRRRIAAILHKLGDEISPIEKEKYEDISMKEDTSPEAIQRRESALEELERRATILESRRRNETGTDYSKAAQRCAGKKSSVSSFDTLVDSDGRLRKADDMHTDIERGFTTGIDLNSETEAAVLRRHDTISDPVATKSSPLPRSFSPEQKQNTLENVADDQPQHPTLITAPPSDLSSNHPSEALVDLTPTSEWSSHHSPALTRTQSEIDCFYAHPEHVGSTDNFTSPMAEEQLPYVLAAPSHASNTSLHHMGHQDPFEDGNASVLSSDTMSDLANTDAGHVQTPETWSEVASVVSDDAHHH